MAPVSDIPGYDPWAAVPAQTSLTPAPPAQVRRGFLVALVVAALLFAGLLVAGVVVSVVAHRQSARNEAAERALAAVQWPAPLTPSTDGCARTRVRMCLLDRQSPEDAATAAADALGLLGALTDDERAAGGGLVVSGTFHGVPVTVTAYPRTVYAPGTGTPSQVSLVEVELDASTVLVRQERG